MSKGGTAAVAALLLWIATSACASSNEAACRVDGLYSVTGVKESGTCEDPGGGTVVDVFELSPSGLEATLRIQGFTGGCTGKVNGCTWTAACEIILTDPIRPGDRGTAQYSYTFTNTGFTGVVAASIPPATSLPKGCDGTTKATGQRR